MSPAKTAGYSGTPLEKKLGVQPGHRLLVVGAPDDFVGGTLALPEGTTVVAAGALEGGAAQHPGAADAGRRLRGGGRSVMYCSDHTRDDVRTLITALKSNEPVWYAPDQSYRKKGAEMVPFFGIPAATNTATSRLARMTGAAVLPYFQERMPDGKFRMVIHPMLENFPSDDPVADAKRFNEYIEAQVRRVPEQYLWIHRRFKGLTPDYPDYYRRKR